MFKKIWKKLDGSKRIIGIVVAIVGCGANAVPFLQPLAIPLIYSGLTIAGIGVVHAVKKNLKQENQNESTKISG